MRIQSTLAHIGLTMAWFAVAAATAQARELEEILVTAARQPVSTFATPLSIGRVGPEAIALIGATHSSEVLNRVPGAMIQRGSGQESLTSIRSPVLTGAGSCGAFLFLENGISIRPVGFCNVNEMLEINTEQADTIEVVRGTGSALYGSNAVHGTVNVLEYEPATLPTARLGLEAGPDDYGRLKAVGRLRSSSTDLGLRAHYTHDGGWRDDSGYEEAKLNATLVSTEADALPNRLDLAATDLEQATAGFVTGRNAYRDEALRVTNANPEAFRNASAVRLAGWLQPPTSMPARLQLRPYLRTSRMEFLQHFLLGQPLEQNGQQSAGLLTSLDWEMGPRASLIAGVDLEWGDSFLVEDQARPTTDGSPAANAIRPAGKHYDYSVTSTVAALYGQFEYALSDRVHAGVGLRAEQVGYDYDNQMLAGNTDENGVPCVPVACLYSRPADRRDSFGNLAPKLTLRWNVHDDLLLYANASLGFRPPELTELYRLQRSQAVADLDSEQIEAFEAGVKAQIGDWRFDVAAFDMRKSNVILRESNGFYVSNGETTHRGVEYHFAWQPRDAVTATVAGTFARHRYDFSRAVEGGETITHGNDVDTAPRELLRAALQYQPATGVALEAEWLMVGKYWLDAANEHRYAGHELLNIRGRWQFARRWAASLRLNNALDRAYADRADFAFGTYRYFPGRPRTLFAELSWTMD